MATPSLFLLTLNMQARTCKRMDCLCMRRLHSCEEFHLEDDAATLLSGVREIEYTSCLIIPMYPIHLTLMLTLSSLHRDWWKGYNLLFDGITQDMLIVCVDCSLEFWSGKVEKPLMTSILQSSDEMFRVACIMHAYLEVMNLQLTSHVFSLMSVWMCES